MSKAILYGVGVGPGDPELLTLKALRTIEHCPVIAAPQTANGAMLALDIAKQAADLTGKEILPLHFAMSRDASVLAQSHAAAAQLILARLQAGQSVALLNLGDVSIYATFNYIKELVEPAGWPVVMIPGVPSFCAVAAALGENLTPQMGTPLHIVPAASADLDEVLDLPGSKVIMKAGKPLAEVKQCLRAKGLYNKAKLVQNCCLPDQHIAHNLDEAEENGGYFTTMVVKA